MSISVKIGMKRVNGKGISSMLVEGGESWWVELAYITAADRCTCEWNPEKETLPHIGMGSNTKINGKAKLKENSNV